MKMFAAPPREYRRLEDYLDFFVDEDLAFEPGTSWAYSNGGYLVLGLAIEALTGRPYAEVVRDNVLTPAGMHDTGFEQPPSGSAPYALNYSRMLSPDGAEAVIGLFRTLGRNSSDQFAIPADLIAGVFEEMHRMHAGHGLGRLGIDAGDFRVRMLAGEHLGDERAGGVDVRGIFGVA